MNIFFEIPKEYEKDEKNENLLFSDYFDIFGDFRD